MTSEAASGAGIVGMGMVAALGDNMAMNCAAARAGIVRSAALENYVLRSDVEGRAEPVIGHAVGLLTRGFEGDVRLLRLAQGALADLASQTPNIAWKTRRVGCYVALPAADRVTPDPPEPVEGLEPPEPISAASEFERTGRLLHQALSLAGFPSIPVLAGLRTSGHAAGLEVLRDACADLRVGRFDMALVLAVDSLLDERAIDWLNANNRLKCDGVPDGLQPGEAAIALLLTGEDQPSAEKPVAHLHPVHTGKEPRHLLAALPARGEVLATVIAQAWTQAGAPAPWLIMDLNGEPHRAMEWGYALVRLRASSAAFAEPLVWYTAASFGDAGAASALIGICLSVRSWERNYAPGDSAIIASVSDGEARAAVAVRRS